VTGLWLWLRSVLLGFCGRHCSTSLRLGAHRDCDRRRCSRAHEGPQSHRSSCGEAFTTRGVILANGNPGRPRNRDRDDAPSHWPRTDGGQAWPSGRQRRSAFQRRRSSPDTAGSMVHGNAAKCSWLLRQRQDSGTRHCKGHCHITEARSAPAAARNTTTTHDGIRQTTRSKNPVTARAKSPGVTTALFHTGS